MTRPRPSCCRRSCAVRSDSPISDGHDRRSRAGTDPDLDAALPSRADAGLPVPARCTCPAGTFGSTRRPSSTRRFKPASGDDRPRLVDRAARQRRHLDLPGLERETHRGGGKQHVGQQQGAAQEQQFACAPDARLEGMDPESLAQVLSFHQHGGEERLESDRGTAASVNGSPAAPKSGVPAQKASATTARSPPARSSRSSRRAGRQAATTAAAWSSMRSWPAASPADPSSLRRHLMSGSRRMVPSPEHGASRSTLSKRSAERQRRRRRPGRRGRCRPPSAGGVRQQVDPARSHVAGDDRTAVCQPRRHDHRLSARRGARIEDPLAGLGAGEVADQLRGFVLDEEQAVLVQAESEGLPAEPPGRPARASAARFRRPPPPAAAARSSRVDLSG